ncbi:MAG TPA: FtsK/SpoIIIE domain-containing protein, partial [Frankiaceae bacterium]|nr:FtsK/SpoIIIE domain-containing protein [Frankiaceae bacterium]
MSSVASEPPVALARPVLPELNARGQIDIPAPPIRPEDERGWLAVILPALSALGMIGFLVLSPNVLVIALGGGFALLSAVGAVVAGRQRRRRCQRSWMAREGQFRTRLAQSAESFAEAALRQRTHALVVHPAPDAAASAAAEGAVWERQPGTAEHLHVRVGIGPGPARLSPRRSSGGDDSGAEPALSALAEGVLGRYGAVAGLPLALDVADARGLVLHGDHLPLLRAMIVSLTRAHGPRSVLLHVLAPPAELAWIRQLPHAGRTGSDPAAFAAAVRAHLRASSTDPAEPFHAIVLAATADSTLLAWRSLAPLVEQSPHSKRPPLSLIGLLPRDSSVPQEASAVAVGDGEGGLLVRRLGGGPTHATVARPDAISHPQACRYAKAIHQRLEADEAAVSDLSPLLLDSLAGGDRSALQIPIGVDDDGMVVLVDPREAARHGDGPHGLIVGATGSGKSELLRTLLTAAAQQNRAEELTFLLVDFKGGAALAELAGLPHTVGVLTNLTADVHGVTRLCAALRAELRRRQSILREAAVDNLDSYQQTGGEALPRLLVVVDEYAELIEQSPDVLDVLTSLARLGRSLGIHLLLCSQRLDDGRLRGLEAHLRFRICLRTFTAAESIAVVGSAVASALPPSPGWAYLSRDGNLTRFRVALVADPRAAVAAVARSGGGTPQRPVCLPPLPRLLTLDCLPEEQGSSPTTAAIGVLDVPGTAQHPPLLYDLAVDGHVAVVGAPRAGRSTALTTLVAALASRVPSRELAVHVVAPADGPLAGLAGLPHVGTVATSPELAARVIRTVADAVTERRASNTAPHGRVLLVIDDLGALLAADESVAPAINLIAATGQSVGVT